MMKVYSNIYAQKIYDILAPLVGDIVAKGTIKSQANSAGCNEETIQKSDLTKITEGIRRGLVIFLGSETASKIANKISLIN